MTAFHYIDLSGGCHFYSRPRLVADGVAKFQDAAAKAGREAPAAGYMTKEVMHSQAIYLSNFIVPPYKAVDTKTACGRAIVDIQSLQDDF